MKKERTKEDIIQQKKLAIRKINNMLEKYISIGDEKHLKKTDLLSFWLATYSNYIQEEECFDSTKLLHYKRGDVIRVNFGFRVGKEFGGLHFAIVLENDNAHNADVITVIPLSSSDGKSIHPRSVDLGTELFEKASSKHSTMLADAKNQLAHLESQLEMMTEVQDTLSKLAPKDTTELDPEFISKVQNVSDFLDAIETQYNKFLQDIEILNKWHYELMNMKGGSMALVNQITTVSKQRIYIPKKATDFLYGISFSSTAMNKIDEKIKELFLFSK